MRCLYLFLVLSLCCFGAYGEASQSVHNLIKVVAEELAEVKGDELGVDKERQVGVFTQRIRCAWGMAAIRARARSRAVWKPLVGCSRLQSAGARAHCWELCGPQG